MLTKIKFLLVPTFIGLALAFIILLFMPNLRPLQWKNATVSDAITSNHLSFANAVKRASPAVVTIYSETFTNQPRYMRGQNSIQELGSGVIMSDKGYILTNYHVINNADQVMITLTDGRQFNDVQLIGYDTVTDLALLKIEAQHLPVIPIDDKFIPQVGDVVLTIGNPLNLGQTITQGIISATGKQNLPQKSSHSNLLQMDAPINVGNSGGALVNSNGILIGINSAQFKAQRNIDIQGIFFAVPYFLAKEVMNKLIKHGQVVRGYLGFNADPVDNTGKVLSNPLSPIFGMQLNSIDPLGPAWQAGLKEDDIVVKIDSKKIVNLQLTLEQIADTLPESIIMFEVYRNGKPHNIKVKVGKLEPTP